MLYTFLISSQDHAEHALRLASALHTRGHTVAQVFFFGDAVHIGLNDESTRHWQGFRDLSHGTELVLCSASADKLGITTAPEHFEIAGLATLIMTSSETERTLHFG